MLVPLLLLTLSLVYRNESDYLLTLSLIYRNESDYKRGTIILPGEGGCQRRCQGDSYKAGCHEGIKERRLVVDYVSGYLRFIVLSLTVDVLSLR